MSSTNTFDVANRLIESQRNNQTVQPIYDGVGNRVAQVTNGVTTTFALDIMGLPEVIYTSDDTKYLHLPGLIMTENTTGTQRFLLSDNLGSIRQVVDEDGEVVATQTFDPYGNLFEGSESQYGFTGEWWEDDLELLHLRARWYIPEMGIFLSRDPWPGTTIRPNTLHGYIYATNNPILYSDPGGMDYLPALDRYTCDDPQTVNGYVTHYDNASGTWGMWPCIVNANNALTNNGPTAPPLLRTTLPLPENHLPYLPIILTEGCPVNDSQPNQIKRIPWSNGLGEWIVFPPDQPPVLQRHPGIKGVGEGLTGSIGVAVDVYEIVLTAWGVVPDKASIFDIGISALGSYMTGESYYAKPHESLPEMLVISQDVFVTTADAVVSIVGKRVLQGAGLFMGGQGVFAGKVAGDMLDVVSSAAEMYYSFARTVNNVPLYFSYAVFVEDNKLKHAILVHGQQVK